MCKCYLITPPVPDFFSVVVTVVVVMYNCLNVAQRETLNLFYKLLEKFQITLNFIKVKKNLQILRSENLLYCVGFSSLNHYLGS